MSAEPIARFFQSLYECLREANIKNGDVVGWG